MSETIRMPFDASWKPEIGTIESITKFEEDGVAMMDVEVTLGKLFQGQYMGETFEGFRKESAVAETEVHCYCLRLVTK